MGGAGRVQHEIWFQANFCTLSYHLVFFVPNYNFVKIAFFKKKGVFCRSLEFLCLKSNF